MRCGLGDPTAPALRAPLRCSLHAGSAQTRFAQTCATLFPPEAALLSGAEGIARPAPHAGLRGVRAIPTSPTSMQPQRLSGGGRYALGRPLRHRRAAQRQADKGPRVFERNAVERVCADPACREQRRAAAKRPVTSAGPGHTAHRRGQVGVASALETSRRFEHPQARHAVRDGRSPLRR